MLAVVTWFTDVRAEEQRLPTSPATNKASPLPARITEAVTARLPKYVPLPLQLVNQPPAPPGTTRGSDLPDEILYLPDIKVTTVKAPPVSDFAFLTPKGRLELALKHNPGLGFGPFLKLNNAIALEIQTEEREAAKRAALTEQVLSIGVGDEAKVKEEIRLMRAATARPNLDWVGRK
jgi:hypothetical protein